MAKEKQIIEEFRKTFLDTDGDYHKIGSSVYMETFIKQALKQVNTPFLHKLNKCYTESV